MNFYSNFYLVKGRIKDFETCTFNGRKSDIELEQQENKIIPLLESLLKKNKEVKSNKKTVWFIEMDNCKWVNGKFNFDKSELSLNKTDWTPPEFVKADRKFLKEDEKALARPDKEESYD